MRSRTVAMPMALYLAAASSVGAQQPMKLPPSLAYISTRWFNVWDAVGRPVALVCYSVPVQALIWRGPAEDRHADMRLRFQYTAADGALHDSIWTWRPTPSAVSPLSPIVTGSVVLRINGQVKSWGLTATDDTSATGLPRPNPVDLAAASPALALSETGNVILARARRAHKRHDVFGAPRKLGSGPSRQAG